MKALFIGGTGTISSAISALCVQRGWELTLLNRGTSSQYAPEGVRFLQADIHDEAAVRKVLGDEKFDVVADFIAFVPEHVERDIRLFAGRTGQYFFISSASAYQKPMSIPMVTEGTPLHNPYWQYSRDKAACEDVLMRAYREQGFPVTIIRPSHTYNERRIPVALHGKNGPFQVLERIRTGRKVIVPGDGLSLWTVTHSRDFAVAFVGLMGNIHALGEVFHITSDEALTWNQIHEAVGKALGMEVKMLHVSSDTLAKLGKDFSGMLLGDKSNCALFDNSKIKRLVPEFNATYRFDLGVRESVEYLLAHPECQKLDPEFDAWCDRLVESYERMAASLPRFDI